VPCRAASTRVASAASAPQRKCTAGYRKHQPSDERQPEFSEARALEAACGSLDADEAIRISYLLAGISTLQAIRQHSWAGGLLARLAASALYTLRESGRHAAAFREATTLCALVGGQSAVKVAATGQK
jgi:hypothetical protein